MSFECCMIKNIRKSIKIIFLKLTVIKIICLISNSYIFIIEKNLTYYFILNDIQLNYDI